MNVIEVAVRDENGVHARELVPGGILRIAADPRIHHDDFARGLLELKCAVSEPFYGGGGWLDDRAIFRRSSLFFFPGIDNRRDLLEQLRGRRFGTSAN